MAKEKQKICPICNQKLSFLKATLKDGIKVCSKHVVNEAGLMFTKIIEQSTVEDIKERIELLQVAKEELSKEVDNFVIAKQIGNFVAFDETQQKWATLNSSSGSVMRTFNYSDIIDFELLEDGESVATGGLGRALVGGVLFGGVGAIVGGVTGKRKTKEFCSSLKLKVTIEDLHNPVVYVNFIEAQIKKDGFAYKIIAEAAQECLSVFQLICDKQQKERKEVNSPSLSSADEIKKFKELLDEGILTQEEFDQKKKQLLEL